MQSTRRETILPTILVKDYKGDMLADPSTLLDRQMYCFRQLLDVCGVNEFRQAEIHMAELLVLKASASDIETDTENLMFIGPCIIVIVEG